MTEIREMSIADLVARKSAKWKEGLDGPISSTPAEMDFALAPAIRAVLQDCIEHEQFGYAPHGEMGPVHSLKVSFVERMRNMFGWTISGTDEVVVLNDLVQAVMACVYAFAKPDDGIVLQVPAYPGFLSVIEQSGRRLLCNPMIVTDTGYKLDGDQFAAISGEGASIFLLCHPQNPTGRAFSKVELSPLISAATAAGMVIISDEIHADIMLGGRTHVPLAKMFPEHAGQIVTLYSATKSFNIPGLRTAIMHFGSPELKARFDAFVPPYILGTPGTPGMIATMAAWDQSSDWLAALMAHLENQRDHMIGRISAELPEVSMPVPEATYMSWANLSAFGLQGDASEYLRENANVSLGNGAMFGPGYGQFVRINFATSTSILDEKLDRIVRALRSNKAA